MSRPCASRARAFTRTSNAVSVPRRAMRFASRSGLWVTSGMNAIIARSRPLSCRELFHPAGLQKRPGFVDRDVPDFRHLVVAALIKAAPVPILQIGAQRFRIELPNGLIIR